MPLRTKPRSGGTPPGTRQRAAGRPHRPSTAESSAPARAQPSPSAAIAVVHDRVAGRLRVRIAALRRNRRHADALIATLGRLPHIRAVKADHRTGTLLVAFDPALPHAEVLDEIAAAVISGDGPPAEPEPTRAKPPRRPVEDGSGAAAHRRGGRRHRTTALPDPVGATTDGVWHATSAAEALRRLEADPLRGLTSAEAERRLARHGRNRVEERPPTGTLEMVGRQLTSLPVGLLLGASAVSVATGGVADALVTLSVVGLNAGIGYGTERGSERLIRTMTARQSSHVDVVRDGREQRVPYDRLVPGDILVLKPATVLAADARLLGADGLTVNEALLTGESEAVEKHAERICSPGEVLAGRANMVHTGSFVVGGSGRAVVVATGAQAETGRIAAATREVETPRTPLERDLENLGQKLVVVSLAACGAFFVAGRLRGRTVLSMFKSAVALAVAAVPEGLPTTATSTLAVGLTELRRKGVLVRRLEAVEGLGSLQVICFDKTGTLTENRMVLARTHLGAEAQALPPGGECSDGVAGCRRRLLEVAVLCSEIVFEAGEAGLVAKGSSTEAALATAALEAGIEPLRLRAEWPLARLQYRTEQNRFMQSEHVAKDGRARRIAVKGDPQQVLERCRLTIDAGGRVAPLTATMRRRIEGASADLAGQGLRVLGFALAEASCPVADDGLVWLGAAGLKDPVAPGVPALLKRLRGAGICPIMITGDQAPTAEAIAREVGLNGTAPLRVLDAPALERVPPQVLAALAQQTDVFARVAPTRKLRIVEALQSAGLIVGMSGDGFNDAPALKAADIAIAVGADSATAARDVADVIVTGGDLGALGDGIEQGRTILSNIRKSVHYMISTNLSEIIVLLAESLNARDELESPLELLWLNLVTDILPGLGLAFEPPERDVMRRPPRPADEPLLTAPDLRHAVLESAVIGASVLGAHAYGLKRYGPGMQTRTVTFLSLVVSQLLHALACRHDRFEPLGGRALLGNPTLNAALLVSSGLQVAPTVSPTLQRLLGIAPPRPADLVVAGLSGLTAFATNEAIMAIRSRMSNADELVLPRT